MFLEIYTKVDMNVCSEWLEPKCLVCPKNTMYVAYYIHNINVNFR